MNERKTWRGLCGVLGIWLSAGIALPMINGSDLKGISIYQIMACRGFIIMLFLLSTARRALRDIDPYTCLIGLVLPLATLGLYQGTRHWGAGPTIIVVTTTPVINLVIRAFSGQKISSAVFLGFLAVLAGAITAHAGGRFNSAGLMWSVFGTTMNGLLYELFSRAKGVATQKCFWGSLGLATYGLVLALANDELGSWKQLGDPVVAITIFVFVGLVGGWIYWISNLAAFDNLDNCAASVLAQGETPAVLLGAYFILGEQLHTNQWFGVLTALAGAGYLSYWLAKEPKPVLVLD